MKRTTWIALGLAAALAGGALWQAALPAPAGAQEQEQAQEMIFGSQLMTAQERSEYRQRLMNAQTEEERQQIRAEHHTRMMERAKERGVTLPEEAPAGGMHMGPGMGGGKGGMGGGMGPGKGMGR
jgi:hypothetical protein